MIVAEFITKKLEKLNLETVFMVTGGASMFLNNYLGKSKKFKKMYCHHEQSASIAAEVYARIKKKPAILNVTAGPGTLNALNGVFGAYTDSIPMIILSGQAKRQTSLQFNKISGLRQLGDQELKTESIVKTIVKKSYVLRNEKNLNKILDKAFEECIYGRPGPVWIDVPIDIQGKYTNEKVRKFKTSKKTFNNKINYKKFFNLIENSKKPLILAGTGIKISKSEKIFLKLVNKLKFPVVTAWTHDIINFENKYFIGRQGTIGTRAGNFATQASDLIIVLGSRLNIRQISYNYKCFAKNAKLIWVDIDKAEFKKKFIKKIDLKINCDLNFFIKKTIKLLKRKKIKENIKWLEWCNLLKLNYTPVESNYRNFKEINPYHFISTLFKNLKNDDILICADATATIVPFQIGYTNKNIRMISNSGCASMGYDLPGTLGALIADTKARIICLAGDGSIMMNIQELAILKNFQSRLKIFLLNNDGYLSIKQTQKNFFGKEYGSSSKSGLTFPNFKKLAFSFGFKSIVLNKKTANWKKKLKDIMKKKFYSFVEVKLSLEQEFEPRLKSRKVKNRIVTPELDDMFPFLDRSELKNIRLDAKKI